MLYDPYEILELLVKGGFLAVAGIPSDGGQVSLWLFVDGYLFQYADLTARSFSNLFGCGIIEPWKKWADLSEVEFELPDKWTKPELKFDVIEGEQEEMK